MLQSARPLAAGNAVRLYTSLPAGASFMRVLRRTTDTFSGPTDSGAVPIVDDFVGDVWIDGDNLVNGTPYFWHAWDWIGSGWVDGGPSVSATPAATWIDDRLDPQEIVRERVALGLAVEISRGTLIPTSGAIQVTTAPFMLAEGITFPTVSVHHENSGPEIRGIGDEITDYFDPQSGLYQSDLGWEARYSLKISAVSLNPDERIALRMALRRIIQVNMPIFADFGMALIEFHQTDREEFSQNDAPLYFADGAFSCLAPAFIRITTPVLTDVDVTNIPDNPLTGVPY